MKRKNKPHFILPIDFIPAFSGLIGKTALVTSFAMVWAAQYHITSPDFVFENVRLEMVIGSIITLIAALLLPNTVPSGTLAPLIVLVPAMASFGVHPFILSVTTGFIGIIAIKTGLFRKLIAMSGIYSKTSLTLAVGISGVLLSLKNLSSFFHDRFIPLFLILLLLTIVYLVLQRCNKLWLIVPASAAVSLVVSVSYGIKIDTNASFSFISFVPDYWWNKMWGLGFGLNIMTILRTLPFAFFILLLWAIDTVSLQAMVEANIKPEDKKEEINYDCSILLASTRNIIGGLFGGAQTSALWRSFLIPLSIVKRPLQPAAILLGILGIVAGFMAFPIKVLSFSPLIWSVLLYGIFLPFVVVGLRNLKAIERKRSYIIIIAAAVGVLYSIIFTWICSIAYEKIERVFQNKLNER